MFAQLPSRVRGEFLQQIVDDDNDAQQMAIVKCWPNFSPSDVI